MHVDLVRQTSKVMPDFEDPARVSSLRVWHCGYQTLSPISQLPALRTLVIATFPDESLSVLGSHADLQYLSILHLPRVRDLAPLARFESLRTLRLATVPGWDASGKVTEVYSLEPLAGLQHLEHLELIGIVPPSRSLEPIERCPALTSARFAKFPSKEVVRFFSATGTADEHAPEPNFA